jgi:hypothetical protein
MQCLCTFIASFVLLLGSLIYEASKIGYQIVKMLGVWSAVAAGCLVHGGEFWPD